MHFSCLGPAHTETPATAGSLPHAPTRRVSARLHLPGLPRLPDVSLPRAGATSGPPLAAHGLRPQTEEVFIECIELTLKGPSPRPYMGRTVGQRSESPFRADKVLF